MAAILALGELVEGQPTGLTLELAALARDLAADAGTGAAVLLVGGDAHAADEVAMVGPDVLLVETSRLDATGVAVAAAEIIERHDPAVLLVAATAEGKDVAGTLLGLTHLPVLVAGTGVSWRDGRITVEMDTFGGRTVTASSFVGGRGIVLVRPGASDVTPAPAPGAIREIDVTPAHSLPPVTLVERVVAAPSGPSIDDADIVVAAGRGVGGPEGVALVEELAAELGAAVGATRAAVDAGWIDFAQQIGQTGKTVRPNLYITAGVSGAIQHRVGMQNAGTIVAIEQDREAPITEFADLVVLGDLFEILPRLSAAVREARGGG